jgi:hypothetical protein
MVYDHSQTHTQPALLGRKLTQRYYRGAHYCETDVDVASSTLAARIVALCRGYAASVVVEIGIALEGRDPTELPEQCLGVLRLARVDMTKAEPLHDECASCDSSFQSATATAATDDAAAGVSADAVVDTTSAAAAGGVVAVVAAAAAVTAAVKVAASSE